jgi:hypothetical protein
MLRYFLASSGEDIHAGFPSGKSAADYPDSKKPTGAPSDRKPRARKTFAETSDGEKPPSRETLFGKAGENDHR